MKIFKRIGALFLILIFLSFFSFDLYADTENFDAVYFGSYNCLVCQSLEETEVLEQIVDSGYHLNKYMSEDDYDLFEEMFTKYAQAYNVPKTINLVPILYAGDKYYAGVDAIVEAINTGEIYNVMNDTSLLPLSDISYLDTSFKDLLVLISSTIILGFLDAFNPCALAMLIMFLSLLTSRKRSKTIAWICFSYISAVFLTYFALGTILQNVLSILVPYMKLFYLLIIILALFISTINFLDYLATRKKEYGKIKNQLPKPIFRVTNKIMKKFSEKVEKGHKSIYGYAFLIGIFVAIVEFPCSGQAFVAWSAIVIDRTSHQFMFYTLLSIYVLIFVSPLIIISFLSLKSNNIVVIANFVRNKMEIIKLMNAIVFLGVAIYYIIHVFF
jgi:cytochrome c biogenesis protein CcdA